MDVVEATVIDGDSPFTAAVITVNPSSTAANRRNACHEANVILSLENTASAAST